MSKRRSFAVTVSLAAAVGACAPPQMLPRFEKTEQESGLASRLQAVFAVNDQTVWASGLKGGVVRTQDGGETWQVLRVPGAGELQFRDVHAFSPRLAYLLSSGEGELSRIYKTSNGGIDWALQFLNLEAMGFLDCFDFWTLEHGLVYGDAVDGELVVLATADGGTTWNRIPSTSLPPAGEGEGGFAASGTCVETGAESSAWIGTGAGGNARVLRTLDGGLSWSEAETPVVKGQAAGIMSVRFDGRFGVAFGGDLERMEARTANVALTRDGGATWRPGGELRLRGPIYGGAWGGSKEKPLLVAAAPGGLDFSIDRGETWHRLSDGNYWSVDFGRPDRLWAVGPEGRITRFDVVEGAK